MDTSLASDFEVALLWFSKLMLHKTRLTGFTSANRYIKVVTYGTYAKYEREQASTSGGDLSVSPFKFLQERCNTV